MVKKRKVHSLTGRIDDRLMMQAFTAVKRNRGAAGIDKVSIGMFEENLDALTCVDGFNLCMTGNNLDDHLRFGVVIENTYGSVVSGNMIEECAGTAIIISSHLLSLVEDICTHLLILSKGQRRFFGPLAELRSTFGQIGADASLEEIFFHATDGTESREKAGDTPEE